MKLLVISDVHGDTSSLEKAIEAENDADFILFLGDGLREVEDYQEVHPQKKIYVVRGNCDNVSFAPFEAFTAFGGVTIFYTHGQYYNVKQGLFSLLATSKERGAKIALFGHTHAPSYLVRDGITLFNPGALSSSMRGSCSYGVIVIKDGRATFEHKNI